MIYDLTSLFRLRLAILNGVAATGGAVLFPLPAESRLLWMIFIGVALLAAGGSALNQVQERELDRLMTRTRLRPVAQGRMRPAMAALIGTAVVLTGILVVGAAGGIVPALVGAVGILLYLTVYTPLKRRTPYALVAGALCGALPPVIGWCSVGGSVTDYRIMLLAGLLYLWQIPHFWLLQQRHEEDYLRAGIPLIGTQTKPAGQNVLFWLWLLAFIASAMLLPAFGIIGRPAALWYAAFPVPLILLALMHSRRLLFIYLNLFPVLLTLVLFFRT